MARYWELLQLVTGLAIALFILRCEDRPATMHAELFTVTRSGQRCQKHIGA